MNKLYFLTALIAIISMLACTDRRIDKDDNQELSELFKMMTGEFSSEEQAEQDTLFYDINLVMFPI
ncbi:MAG: hypothetical protein AAFP82_02830 [Bacteroidota bacterium]